LKSNELQIYFEKIGEMVFSYEKWKVSALFAGLAKQSQLKF